MNCNKCGDDLGNGDEYDLLKSHVWNCRSKEAQAFTDAVEEETSGQVWRY